VSSAQFSHKAAADSEPRFVESIMLFGMDITLSEEEDARLTEVVRPCYASLALANDYFSFDREWKEAQESGTAKPINAVWLYMQWQGVDISTAKGLVRDKAAYFEKQFLDLSNQFRKERAPVSAKLDCYLRALSYQVSGNVVWSLNCPRYHPQFRYDPNAGIEDMLAAKAGRPLSGLHEGHAPVDAVAPERQSSIESPDLYSSDSVLSEAGGSSTPSSMSQASATGDREGEASIELPTGRLGSTVGRLAITSH
jgi:hypothetical protein